MPNRYKQEINAITDALGETELAGVVGAPPKSHSAHLAALIGQHVGVEIVGSPLDVVEKVVAGKGLLAGVVPLNRGGREELTALSDGSTRSIRETVLAHPRLAILAIEGEELTATTRRGTSDSETVAVVISGTSKARRSK